MENANTIEILNDLVEILNDRIEGYTKAKSELEGKEEDLNLLFLAFIDESRELRNELGTEIAVLKGEAETDTTTRGKVYRIWMDLKDAFADGDRHSVLAACEYGEDAAQQAYKAALSEEGLPANLRSLIETQKQTLRASHDQVKALRDAVA
ncbi:MAG: PA2169 family four-helix-bundle protein [Bacteroidota bacterium]